MRTTLENLSHDETPTTSQLEQVKGGLIGLLLPAVHRAGDRPMESLSINFTKIEYKYTPYDDKH